MLSKYCDLCYDKLPTANDSSRSSCWNWINPTSYLNQSICLILAKEDNRKREKNVARIYVSEKHCIVERMVRNNVVANV